MTQLQHTKMKFIRNADVCLRMKKNCYIECSLLEKKVRFPSALPEIWDKMVAEYAVLFKTASHFC